MIDRQVPAKFAIAVTGPLFVADAWGGEGCLRRRLSRLGITAVIKSSFESIWRYGYGCASRSTRPSEWAAHL